MATHELQAPPAHSPPLAPPQSTTRRGIAAWSFASGIWSCFVFWWYPYSLFIAGLGLVLGLIALARGWRGGKDGENLALAGVVMCAAVIGTTLTVYRVMQMFFNDLSVPIAP
jgi:hypothetical protein